MPALSQSANMTDAGWYLKEWRERSGLTMEGLAERAQTSPGQVSDLEKGKRRFNRDWLEKFAGALDINPADLFRNPANDGPTQRLTVPLVGYVGAGAEAHFYATGDEGLGEVDAPEGSTAETRAAEIRGESLGPLFDTWLVFYDDVRTPVTPDLIGRLCIVGLPDDKVLVKKLQRSRSGGNLFHLLSNNEAPMLDQEVVWAARIKSMTPR
jgi:transcriptional regulator with XRE-family HTH domain